MYNFMLLYIYIYIHVWTSKYPSTINAINVFSPKWYNGTQFFQFCSLKYRRIALAFW